MAQALELMEMPRGVRRAANERGAARRRRRRAAQAAGRGGGKGRWRGGWSRREPASGRQERLDDGAVAAGATARAGTAGRHGVRAGAARKAAAARAAATARRGGRWRRSSTTWTRASERARWRARRR
eukprot:1476580-Prymnesium_polylepis.1